MSTPSHEQLTAALATVHDPEIKRPITDLGMVDTLEVDADGVVAVTVLLTVAGCPLRDTIDREVNAAVRAVPGVRQHDADALDDEHQAAGKKQPDDEAEQVGRDKVSPTVRPDLARMQGHQTAQTLRRKQHDEHEDQALIEQP